MVLKRFNKLVPLEQAVERLAVQHPEQRVRQKLAKLSPTLIFGARVGTLIESMELEEGVLRLSVPDPAWRQELHRYRGKLLERARKAMPRLKRLEIHDGV